MWSMPTTVAFGDRRWNTAHTAVVSELDPAQRTVPAPTAYVEYTPSRRVREGKVVEQVLTRMGVHVRRRDGRVESDASALVVNCNQIPLRRVLVGPVARRQVVCPVDLLHRLASEASVHIHLCYPRRVDHPVR